MKINLNWTVGHASGKEVAPEKMVPANVPGNANLDWAKAENMPDWKQGLGFREYKWMEDCWWIYEAVLPKVDLQAGQGLFFVAEGIDYEYEIYVDGQKCLYHEGMFTRVELPLVGVAREGALLQVKIYPAPKDPLGAKDTRQEAAQSVKPAVSYEWDWHPRLIPMGIWEEAYLEVRDASYIVDTRMDYRISPDLSSAQIEFSCEFVGEGEALLTLEDPEGKTFVAKAGEMLTIPWPMLWWCRGYGEPNLYSWTVTLQKDGKTLDEKRGKTGLRKVELTMNEGSWNEPEGFPKGRSPVPITLTLNNVPVFAKGSNWVNPEVFTGTITRETYEPLIDLAIEANFNIFRIWGGGIINKESFFELCDEKGIMVWEEFPLACNDYRNSDHYLRVLEQEARAIILRLKKHPSVVLWCGGNELFNNWSLMTDQSHALRLLNKLCYELDQNTPFNATSPLFGMAHGCYLFRYPDGREVFQVMPASHNTAYTEFGVPSFSNYETCLEAVGEENLFPMECNEVTTAHHAFYAWTGLHTWSQMDTLEDYFGKPASIEDLIWQSQWLQAEGYRCIFEEARRQKPYCSMAINWDFNEPWPTLCNNSLINYPATKKASFPVVAAACRDRLVSARIPKFSWRGGESFSFDLFVLNDGRLPVEGGEVEAFVELCGKTYPVGQWRFGQVAANQNLAGPTLRISLPKLVEHQSGGIVGLNQGPVVPGRGEMYEMQLVLQAGELSSTYRLVYYA